MAESLGRRRGPAGPPGRGVVGQPAPVGAWLAGLGAASVLALWAGADAAARLGTGCPPPPARTALGVALYALTHRDAPVPGPAGCRASAVVFWLAAGLAAGACGAVAAAVALRRGGASGPPGGLRGAGRRRLPLGTWVPRRRAGRRAAADRRAARFRAGAGAARWATRSDLAPLLVRSPAPGRLVIGRWGRHLLAAEARQSVLVVGPTQTMKTSGFAVPALLEWEGPILATSVKTDLVRDTLAHRRRQGRAWIFDPARCTGLPSQGWSPLASAATWQGARRAAAAMVAAARSGSAGSADADFWYATATKMLAPLLFAAAVSGRSMSDVVRWVDTQETAEVVAVLAAAGVEEALTAAEASFGREERARSSIFTTTETVLDPFADPDVADGESRAEIDPAPLLDGGAHALYLCAPSHEQRRLRPLFSALVDQVVSAVYERAAATGRPLDPPLLVVLDEAAAIAPLEDLDGLAATGAGQGIQLVTVWQDLAQVGARYGARAPSVVNNHRAKVLLSGVSDAATLEAVSGLVGEAGAPEASVTTDEAGGRSTTESAPLRRLAPGDSLRRMPPGHGLLVYGHLQPARIRLRPWFEDPTLSRLAGR